VTPSKRKFYRTVIEVEVLSEEPYDPQTLGGIAHDIMNGDCSGQWEVKENMEVDGPTMAKMLQEQGSDPEFFQLTEDGEDQDMVEKTKMSRKVYLLIQPWDYSSANAWAFNSPEDRQKFIDSNEWQGNSKGYLILSEEEI
jgi:hypothetical protein